MSLRDYAPRKDGDGLNIPGMSTSLLEILLLVTIVSALVPLLLPKIFGNGKDSEQE